MVMERLPARRKFYKNGYKDRLPQSGKVTRWTRKGCPQGENYTKWIWKGCPQGKTFTKWKWKMPIWDIYIDLINSQKLHGFQGFQGPENCMVFKVLKVQPENYMKFMVCKVLFQKQPFSRFSRSRIYPAVYINSTWVLVNLKANV